MYIWVCNEITGLFCRISSLWQGSFAKEAHNFKEPTSRSHPIADASFVQYIYIYECTLPNTYKCMGWLRFVGSMKLQVSFAKYSLFDRALLQKRPVILSILLTKATPYVDMWIYEYVCMCVFGYVYTCIRVWHSNVYLSTHTSLVWHVQRGCAWGGGLCLYYTHFKP